MSERKSIAVPILIAVLIVVGTPVLYALSIVPAHWMLMQGWISLDTYKWLYTPLAWLAGAFPPLRDFLVWYWWTEE